MAMLTSFTAINFRVFHRVTIEPLGRINLIIGRNNSGKTALLEAMYLHCQPHNARAPLQVNECRGIEPPLNPPEPVEESLEWLFIDRHTSSPIELTSSGENGCQRKLAIRLLGSQAMI